MQGLKAGVFCFALVFGAGFVLGTIRTLLVVPRLGARIMDPRHTVAWRTTFNDSSSGRNFKGWKYIRDFDRITANTRTALELYSQMLAIYPHRVNPAILWFSARAMKPVT